MSSVELSLSFFHFIYFNINALLSFLSFFFELLLFFRQL